MKVIVGLIIISIGFYLSLNHLDQTILQFWDFIAFVMVCLGTFSVSIMTMPSFKLKHFFSVLKAGLRSNAHFREKCIPIITCITGNGLKISKPKTTYRKNKSIITGVIVGLSTMKVTEKFRAKDESKMKPKQIEGRTAYKKQIYRKDKENPVANNVYKT